MFVIIFSFIFASFCVRFSLLEIKKKIPVCICCMKTLIARKLENLNRIPLGTSATAGSQKSATKMDTAGTGEVQRRMFSKNTKAIVWGMQTRAVQSMLDFDFICRREEPSVVAMVYPFTGYHRQKFYWGHKEILIPVYNKMFDAINKHKEADVLVNFASLRSAYESSMEVVNDFPQIRTIAIIAEGIPENLTRKLNMAATEKGVSIIGPATVGGVKPGCFKM